MIEVGAKVILPFSVIYAISCVVTWVVLLVSVFFWFVHGVIVFLPLCYVHDNIAYLKGNITSDSK
jgi:hypothetical protein